MTKTIRVLKMKIELSEDNQQINTIYPSLYIIRTQ